MLLAYGGMVQIVRLMMTAERVVKSSTAGDDTRPQATGVQLGLASGSSSPAPAAEGVARWLRLQLRSESRHLNPPPIG